MAFTSAPDGFAKLRLFQLTAPMIAYPPLFLHRTTPRTRLVRPYHFEMETSRGRVSQWRRGQKSAIHHAKHQRSHKQRADPPSCTRRAVYILRTLCPWSQRRLCHHWARLGPDRVRRHVLSAAIKVYEFTRLRRRSRQLQRCRAPVSKRHARLSGEPVGVSFGNHSYVDLLERFLQKVMLLMAVASWSGPSSTTGSFELQTGFVAGAPSQQKHQHQSRSMSMSRKCSCLFPRPQ